MAANTGQGRSFTTFLVGFTAICYGIAYFSTGFGKISAVAGAALFLGSLVGFMKLKPLEGRVARGPSSKGMKLGGAFLSCFGWIITLFGIHLVPSVGGRIGFALFGIVVSLFGIIYVLPSAFNKNAIWKT
ncbi:MAG: hypothetical protein ACRD2S_00885 [Terriglobales bacterium]